MARQARIAVLVTLSCDACGSPHTREDQILCGNCAARSVAGRLGHSILSQGSIGARGARIHECFRCGKSGGTDANALTGEVFSVQCGG